MRWEKLVKCPKCLVCTGLNWKSGVSLSNVPHPRGSVQRLKEDVMPLSDHEQELLAQMERALASEDPRFASAFRNPKTRRGVPKNTGLAIAIVLTGIAILIAGVATSIPALGIVGFVAIVAGITMVVSAPRKNAGVAGNLKGKASSTKSGFMEGLEGRWERRQDNQ